MSFKKAERRQVKIKLAITGPSGSGKTFSALRLAKGIGGRVAVIDTENGSASLYADRFEFDSLEIAPPFTTDRYIAAIMDAVKLGYNVLIVDSLTQQWAGEGGLLNRKEQLDSRPGSNSYANWAKMTPEHEKFKAAILHSDIHLISTMRSKQDYVLSENEKGKQAPKKMGLAPIQRDGMEYEFTTVFDVAMNHETAVSKDRTGLFVDQIFQITEETGTRLIEWLGTAAPAEPKAPPPVTPKTGPAIKPKEDAPKTECGDLEVQLLKQAALDAKWSLDSVRARIFAAFGTDKVKGLTKQQFATILQHVKMTPEGTPLDLGPAVMAAGDGDL